MAAIDSAELNSWIGRTLDAVDIVAPRLVEAYRATLAPHLAAVEALHAPLGLHWCLAPQMASMSELGPDGHPALGGFLPPVPLPRRMWAGGEIELLAPLRIGDQVTRRSTIAGISAKQGRSGPLYIVEVRHDFSIDGSTVIRERQDIVYRNATPRVSAAGQRVAASARSPRSCEKGTDLFSENSENGSVPFLDDDHESALAWTVKASPVLLFRYSALTFNGHRIHYDQAYATGIEGYDGLVVHGPLQASLLLNLAASVLHDCPSRFTYRSIAPLIAGQSFEVCAAREREGVVDCRVHDITGHITCEATAVK